MGISDVSTPSGKKRKKDHGSPFIGDAAKETGGGSGDEEEYDVGGRYISDDKPCCPAPRVQEKCAERMAAVLAMGVQSCVRHACYWPKARPMMLWKNSRFC